jgi:hypothetical protein
MSVPPYEEDLGLGLALLESCPEAGKKAVAASTLCTIIGNLVNKPQEDKYRRIRITNQVHARRTAFLVLQGLLSCLFNVSRS